ncbi:MAG TPA: T9SS type A sorting domain-containing protein [Ignavibacteria bacterium]|jgi:hypothetical protein
MKKLYIFLALITLINPPAKSQSSGVSANDYNKDRSYGIVVDQQNNIIFTSSEDRTYGIIVDRQNGVIPTEYKLYQNYPNPFNPATKIKFDLPKESNVSLLVYNQAGELVKTLIDNSLEAGEHEVIFRADELSSGIYFCSIISGSFSRIIKLVLIK